MMIEDWETGQLFWKCLSKYDGDEQKECADVRKKYFDDFAKTKDLYFSIGTTLAHHKRSPESIYHHWYFPPKEETTVKTLLIFLPLFLPHKKHPLQMFDLQGVFNSICRGSGTINY